MTMLDSNAHHAKVVDMGAVREQLSKEALAASDVNQHLDKAITLIEMARNFARHFVDADPEQPIRACHLHMEGSGRFEDIPKLTDVLKEAMENTKCPKCKNTLGTAVIHLNTYYLNHDADYMGLYKDTLHELEKCRKMYNDMEKRFLATTDEIDCAKQRIKELEIKLAKKTKCGHTLLPLWDDLEASLITPKTLVERLKDIAKNSCCTEEWASMTRVAEHIEHYHNELEKAKAELEALEKHFSIVKEDRDKIMRTVESLRSDLEHQTNLTSFKHTTILSQQGRFKELTEKLDEANSKARKLEAVIQDDGVLIKELEEKLSAAKGVIAEQDAREHYGDGPDKDDRIKQLESTLEGAMSLAKGKDDLIAELETRIKHLECQNEHLGKQYRRQEQISLDRIEKMVALEHRIKELEDKLNKAGGVRHELQDKVEKDRLAGLVKDFRINELQNKLQDVEKELAIYKEICRGPYREMPSGPSYPQMPVVTCDTSTSGGVI